MSEKIYALLLRLYPSHFRQIYGEAALQLFRDRFRNEKGFLPGLRLWSDLLFDLAVSLPLEHRRVQPALVPASAPHRLDGVPTFLVLEDQQPRPGALLYASAVSLIVFGSILFSIGHGGKYQPWNTRDQSSPDPRLSASADPPDQPRSPSNQEMSAFVIPATNTPNTFLSKPPSSSTAVIGHAQPQQAKAEDATTAIIRLFHDHDIVMLGEVHGNKQEYEWLFRLVNDPRFADRVDDIVVEFGNSLYQRPVDRYVAGEDVPFDQVQKAWRNMIASVPPVSPVYGHFYQAVRDANLTPGRRHKIRLLLASPPGDWEKIRSSADLAPYEAEREQWYAQVVKDEVLAKHHRALLIMGAGHFLRGGALALQDELLAQQHRAVPPVDRTQLAPGYIERELRAAGAKTYLVVLGTNAVDNRGDVDKRFDSWPVPAIVPLSANWVGELPAQPVITGGHAAATPLRLADQADALLYVAPCDLLKSLNVSPSEMESAYAKEIARRNIIEVGHPILFPYGEAPQCAQPPSSH